jgi:hypothetical protein
MRALLLASLGAVSFAVLATEPPVEIDPNTKIQGGADVRGSGAQAGAGARPDDKAGSGPRVEERESAARPDKSEPKEDKPISARKPQEDPAKGESAPAPR